MKTKTNPTRRQNGKRVSSGSSKSTIPTGQSLRDLARRRGATVFDPKAFAGIVPPGEDIGEFVEEIYRART